MKYIKTFEIISSNPNMDQYVGNRYWLIPTDNRLEDSLNKIGCGVIESFLNHPHIFQYDYIFINNYTWFGKNQWSWNKYDGIEKDLTFEESGSMYSGTVNIREGELEGNKYNL